MAEGEVGILRRVRAGARAEDFFSWEEQAFDEMDSTLAVQQFIQQSIRKDISNIDGILHPPEGQDEGVWKYEHLRQFCLELNGLAVKLQLECNPDTCSQMTATEQWIFLCAAHKTPKECPAIDFHKKHLRIPAGLASFGEKQVELNENETFLCRRFSTFVTKYNLMPKDNLIVPILEESQGSMESEA
nr:MOB-like protein phocein [Lytechinus pictus]